MTDPQQSTQDALERGFIRILPAVIAATRRFIGAVAAAIFGTGAPGPDMAQWPADALWDQTYTAHVDPISDGVHAAASMAAGGPPDPPKIRFPGRAGDLPQDLHAMVLTSLEEGIVAGEPIPALGRRVQTVLADPSWRDWRAQRLARTEATRSLNAGNYAGALSRAQADRTVDDTRKQWLGLPDDRIRPTHRHAHGQVQPLTGRFTVGAVHMLHPGDPGAPVEETVLCRCTMLIFRPGQVPLTFPDPDQLAAGGAPMCNCANENPDIAAVWVTAASPLTAAMTAALAPYETPDGGGEQDVLCAAVVGDTSLPLADADRAWDGNAAEGRIHEWADGDPASYARCYLWRDDDADPATRSAYSMPIADIIEGSPRIVPAAISAAAGRLNQASIPAVAKARIKGKLKTVYKRMDRPDPWQGEAMSAAVGARVTVELADASTAAAVVSDLDEAAGTAVVLTDDGARWQVPVGVFKPDPAALAAAADQSPAGELVAGELVADVPLDMGTLTAAVADGVTLGLSRFAERMSELDRLENAMKTGRLAARETV